MRAPSATERGLNTEGPDTWEDAGALRSALGSDVNQLESPMEDAPTLKDRLDTEAVQATYRRDLRPPRLPPSALQEARSCGR